MEEIKSLKKIEEKQPSNIEAEQALLGSILVNNDIIDQLLSEKRYRERGSTEYLVL